MKRLIPKSRFRKEERTQGDSIKDKRRLRKDSKYNTELLYRARQAWDNLFSFRERRKRIIRYIHGDQWGDWVLDENGNPIRERDRIAKRMGGIVLQSNFMIKYFTTLKGVYSKGVSLPVCFARHEEADAKSTIMTNALQTNYDNNNEKDLLIYEFGELCRGGLPVVVEEWAVRNGVEDTYTFDVNPDYFFFEGGGNDPRLWDETLIGEIRDYPLGELAEELSREDEDCYYTYEMLKEVYRPYLRNEYNINAVQFTEANKEVAWDLPSKENLCRTYRIWTKEHRVRYRCVDIMDKQNPLFKIEESDLPQVIAENESRIAQGLAAGMVIEDIPLIEYKQIWDQYWYMQILGPQGEVLLEKETPYEHGSHPYVYCAYEYVNGDIIPFMNNIVDQQRAVNRLLTQKDAMMQQSLKGLKMIPKDCVPEGMSNSEFAEQFVEIGSFIFYTPSKSGNKPEVITTNSQDAGVTELLQIHKQSMEEITNISGALQGQSPTSGTSASRYAMETENSNTAIASLVQKFNSFEIDLARKKLKNIQQFYTEKRNISTARSTGLVEYSMYEPNEVRDIDFMISVKEGSDTPVSRMLLNDLAMQLWQAGQITAEQMLSSSYYPGKEELLQAVKSANEQAQNMNQQTPEQA